MNTITTLIRIEIWFFLIGMMIVVGYQILTGGLAYGGYCLKRMEPVVIVQCAFSCLLLH